jgi:hypothetical protein
MFSFFLNTSYHKIKKAISNEHTNTYQNTDAYRTNSWFINIETASGFVILFKIIDKLTDENGNNTGVVQITIEPSDKLRAIPLLLTMITKNLQARQRMDNPDEVFEGYDNLEEKSDYLLTLGNVPISYLKILEGGLGDIRKGRDIEPGVIETKEG